MMRKITKLTNLIVIELNQNVISAMGEQLNILYESYRAQRNIDTDLGGYVLILENEEDVIEARENILKDIIPEYVDDIECEGGKQYSLSLFLLSSDYALEKIIVKPQGNREELRFSVYKDQKWYGMKLLVRPLDIKEELFLQLLKKAIDDNLFSKKFITQLKSLINEK